MTPEQAITAHRESVKAVKRALDSVETAEAELAAALEVQAVVQAAAQKVQEEVHATIAAVVSKCLAAVFDDPYSFEIMFERKRGRTEARLVFKRDGREYDPQDDVGGGVVDVAAFALRLACLMARRPRPRKMLILDEPFKWVSAKMEYRDKVRDLLLVLSKDMGVQILMVTHDDVLMCGKVIDLSGDGDGAGK